jgi:hypothetical protein
MTRLALIFFIAFLPVLAAAQAHGGARGSIPDELLRPNRGESPHYPIDTVIGEIGPGDTSDGAYSYANLIMTGFMSMNAGHSGIALVNSSIRENFISLLEAIEPDSFRVGGGRTEPDGAVSYLIRFIGRDHGITGELFIRFIENQTDSAVSAGRWVFEEMILEEAKSREEENRDSLQRFDFSPYERFF